MSYIAPKSGSQDVPIAPGNHAELGGSETQAMTTSLSDVDSTATHPTEPRTIPPAAWLLAVTTFAIISSEFMVAGMLPTLARAFQVSIGAIGFLISLYAVGMAVGGPLVTALLLHRKVPHKRGLVWLLALFLGGSLIAATAQGYTAMALGGIIQGVASAGYFGVALTICAELVAPDRRGRASS
ncbi:MFS transporter [Sphingomonas sp. 2SG]|uniref:MFS transporter n=1 Tax=Sphingomonas sp. 2SG TaxID=2502201 RepID=UPI0010F7D315|nr:MFS transporter [Sphingomonas sp. 2SG]